MEEKEKNKTPKMSNFKKTAAAAMLLTASLLPTQALGNNDSIELENAHRAMKGQIIEMSEIEINQNNKKIIDTLKKAHGINVYNIQIENGDTWQISFTVGNKKWFVFGQSTLDEELKKILKNANNYKDIYPEPQR